MPAGRLIIRDPHGAGSEAGARSVGGRIVQGCANAGDIGPPVIELFGLTQRPYLEEGRGPEVLGPVDLRVEVRRRWHSPTILAASSIQASKTGWGGRT